jgi:hypothetical protein
VKKQGYKPMGKMQDAKMPASAQPAGAAAKKKMMKKKGKTKK